MSIGYIKSLDGVRAIAILLVLSFHYGITEFGWLGVQLFFVLSGYLITGILWREKYKTNGIGNKLKNFWARRSLRIFPLYFSFLIAITVIYFIFNFPGYFPTYSPYLYTYTVNYSRTLSNWQNNPLFTHLWSLSVEEQFYFLFPLIIFFLPGKVVKWFMGAVVILAPLFRFLLGNYYLGRGFSDYITADAIYWNTISHLDAFFIGGLIPVFSLQKKIKKVSIYFLISLGVVVFAGGLNYFLQGTGNAYFTDFGYRHGHIGNYEHVWHYTVLNIFFAFIILTLLSRETNSRGWFIRLMESNWMVRIGKVSYGMYVFHWAILVYFYNRFFYSDNYAIKLLLFIPYVLLVYFFSLLSFQILEKRFIQLKDKYFSGTSKQ